MIGTDGSAYAKTALTTSLHLLRHSENQFYVICDMPNFYRTVRRGDRSPGIIERVILPNEVRVKEKLERALEDVSGMLTTAGIVPHVSTEAGSPADVLVNLAKDYDAVIVERPWLRLGLQEEPLAALEQSYATATEQIEEERRLEKELWSEAEQIIRDRALFWLIETTSEEAIYSAKNRLIEGA